MERKTAVQLASEMNKLRDVKPRPINKLFGSNGPTPDQLEKYKADTRAFNSSMSKLQREHKAALAVDNAEFAAKKLNSTGSHISPSTTSDVAAEGLRGAAKGVGRVLGDASRALGVADFILPKQTVDEALDKIRVRPSAGVQKSGVKRSGGA